MEKTTSLPPDPSKPQLMYETPNFKVLLGNMSGPEGTPVELRRKYVILHKVDRVIYGQAAHLGQAKVAAWQAEHELLAGNAIAEEAETRGAGAVFGNTEGNGSTPPPKFS